MPSRRWSSTTLKWPCSRIEVSMQPDNNQVEPSGRSRIRWHSAGDQLLLNMAARPCPCCPRHSFSATRTAPSRVPFEHSEQRLYRIGGTTFSLFPATDRVLRHIDAPGELVLGEAQALADAAGVVLVLPCGAVPLGRRVQHFIIDAPRRQVSPAAGINRDVRFCHMPHVNI